MKKLFERVTSYRVRYDKYEIRVDTKGTKHNTAAADNVQLYDGGG